MEGKETVKIMSGVKNGWQTIEGFRIMLLVALLFDLLSAIPWVGMIFSGLGYGTIWMWLEMRGVKVSIFTGDTKKLASTAAEFIGGAVGLGIIPGIMMWTFFVVAEHKGRIAREREAEVEAMQKVQKRLAKQRERSLEQIRKANQKKQRTQTSAYL